MTQVIILPRKTRKLLSSTQLLREFEVEKSYFVREEYVGNKVEEQKVKLLYWEYKKGWESICKGSEGLHERVIDTNYRK